MIKRIAIVVGEASGDILGSRLMTELRTINPDIEFEGIGGAAMLAQGFDSFYPMERLSVMGLTEVLGRLPELLSMRHQLIKRWRNKPPDLLIGIDAPDFNLKLEAKLKAAGVAVAHYVSPSVWAWRASRVKKMQGNIDLMLCLFPFEATFYQQHNIPVEYVGHPLADEIPLEDTSLAARQTLGFNVDDKILALLPGSRHSELKYLGDDFILAAEQLQLKYPQLQFVAAMATSALKDDFSSRLAKLAPQLSIRLIEQQSRVAMSAADVILMASGTAVLEGMLIGKPMVAAGRLSALSAWIIRTTGMLNVTYYTLPNNLANKTLVTELMQEEVTVDHLVSAVQACFEQGEDEKKQLEAEYLELHRGLRMNASKSAAKALVHYFGLV